MKRSIIILAFFFSFTDFAQTINGISVDSTSVSQKNDNPSFNKPNFGFNKEDATFKTYSDKDYIVYDVEGYTQKELYNAMLLGLSKLFNNPDKVLTKVENELITVNTVSEYYLLDDSNRYALSYTVRFYFKDGKIRVDKPIVNSIITKTGKEIKDVAGWIKMFNSTILTVGHFGREVNNTILSYLTKSFSKEDTDW